MMTSCAATKYKIDKAPLAHYFETNPIFRESHSGLLVVDMETGSTLFDYNAQKHFIPASNTKLLTYYATTKMMSDSIPALTYCIVGDSLFFSGTGDPSFLYTQFEYSPTFSFLQTTTHQLVYIQKPMTDQRFGPGWAWDDYPYDYSVEKASYPIYGNRAHFYKSLDEEQVNVIPKSFSKLLFIKKDSTVHIKNLKRNEFENLFYMQQPDSAIEIDEVMPFIYSQETFVNLLADTLKKNIAVSAHFPINCEPQTLYSVPTDSISKHILIESDNFLAEQMLLVISNQLRDTLSSEKTIDYVLKTHLVDLVEQIHWVDGSGLSRYNQVTPKALVSVLGKLYHEVPKESLYQFLPESGKNGTIKTSFPELEGKIHAKTGSMSHVYNLSGYLETNSGKTLIFSFMNNNFNVSFSELKTEMERVLTVFVNDK